MISTKRSTGLRLGQDLRVLLQAIVALHVPAHHAVSLRYADPHHIRHVVLPHHAPEPMRGPPGYPLHLETTCLIQAVYNALTRVNLEGSQDRKEVHAQVRKGVQQSCKYEDNGHL